MNVMKSLVAVGTLVAAVGASACAVEGTDSETAPVASDTDVEALDLGNSYNGWSHTPAATGRWGNYEALTSTFYRSSGDATRGGGACYVIGGGGSCSDDSTCTASAKATYGSLAYGYCQSGTCFSRPGSQGNYCALNSNRTAGTLSKSFPFPYIGYTGNNYLFGCLTKNAGPNTACGGTDPSQYVRTIVYLYYPN